MKYLSDYVSDAQSKLFDELGVFFAFSKSQFEEGCKKVGANNENKVIDFGGGGYILSKNYDKFVEEMERINASGIDQDIHENGINRIIQRELANYEVCITGNWKQLLEVLEDYPGINEEVLFEQFTIYMGRS